MEFGAWDLSLALNASLRGEDGTPEKIKLVPAGTFYGRDKRGPFLNKDPDKIIASTIADKLEAGLPIDMNHATFHAGPGGEAPALGWMTSFENKGGEIWATVEWTKAGLKAIRDKAYRYISPAFLFSPDGEVQKILNAGLTNNPNLYFTAICSREGTMELSKETQEKLALHASSIDDIFKLLAEKAQETGLSQGAMLSALADRAISTHARDDKPKPVTGGDVSDGEGDKELEGEMSALRSEETKFLGARERKKGDDDEDDEDDEDSWSREEQFATRCQAASEKAAACGKLEMSAEFARMARAAMGRVEMRKATSEESDEEDVEKAAEHAREAGDHERAMTLRRIAMMKAERPKPISKEEIGKLVQEGVALATKDLRTSIAEMRQGERQAAAAVFVDGAIRQHRLLPSERQAYIGLFVKDEESARQLVDLRQPMTSLTKVETFETPAPGGGTNRVSLNTYEQAVIKGFNISTHEFVERKANPLAVAFGTREDDGEVGAA